MLRIEMLIYKKVWTIMQCGKIDSGIYIFIFSMVKRGSMVMGHHGPRVQLNNVFDPKLSLRVGGQ